MSLLPEIDEQKTKENVHRLLSIYRRLERMAKAEYTPKVTQSYSFEIKGTGGVPTSATESAVMRKVDAESELYKIAKAMNKLNVYRRRLLYDRYMSQEEWTDIQIYNDMCISQGKFYHDLGVAQMHFAEAYDNCRLLVEIRKEL